jgi:hypothetical protein
MNGGPLGLACLTAMNPILEKLQREITLSLEGMTASQTQFRPVKQGDKWTIQQIVQHLCLSYSSTEGGIRGRLEKGRPTLAAPTIQQRCIQLLITKLGYFPSGREAPSTVIPPEVPVSTEDQMAGELLASETARRLAHMDKILDEAESLFGTRRAVTHPILGSLSIAQWRLFHRTHGLHHVKQIWAIRRDHGV